MNYIVGDIGNTSTKICLFNYKKEIINYDAIFIMNNHPQNIKNNFLNSLTNNKIFIFDGWNIIQKSTLSGYENIRYCNLGYSSF